MTRSQLTALWRMTKMYQYTYKLLLLRTRIHYCARNICLITIESWVLTHWSGNHHAIHCLSVSVYFQPQVKFVTHLLLPNFFLFRRLKESFCVLRPCCTHSFQCVEFSPVSSMPSACILDSLTHTYVLYSILLCRWRHTLLRSARGISHLD